jgi:hypothetical protein
MWDQFEGAGKLNAAAQELVNLMDGDRMFVRLLPVLEAEGDLLLPKKGINKFRAAAAAAGLASRKGLTSLVPSSPEGSPARLRSPLPKGISSIDLPTIS